MKVLRLKLLFRFSGDVSRRLKKDYYPGYYGHALLMSAFPLLHEYRDKPFSTKGVFFRGNGASVDAVFLGEEVVRSVGEYVFASEQEFVFKGLKAKMQGLESKGGLEELGEAAPSETATLTFTTPTSFRQGRLNMPLPVVDSLFNSLTKKAVLAGFEVPPDLSARAKKVALSFLAIRTEELVFPRYKVVGFVGDVTLDFRKLQPEERTDLLRLLKLGEITGVGYKTTMMCGSYELAVPSELP